MVKKRIMVLVFAAFSAGVAFAQDYGPELVIEYEGNMSKSEFETFVSKVRKELMGYGVAPEISKQDAREVIQKTLEDEALSSVSIGDVFTVDSESYSKEMFVVLRITKVRGSFIYTYECYAWESLRG